VKPYCITNVRIYGNRENTMRVYPHMADRPVKPNEVQIDPIPEKFSDFLRQVDPNIDNLFEFNEQYQEMIGVWRRKGPYYA